MTDSNGNLVMPVAPMGGYGNSGFGGFGDMGSGWWLILLLICLGGWGNGFGFGGGFGGNGAGTMMVNNDVQRGFDQSALMTGITGVQSAVTSGFGDLQTALCGGFGGVNAAIANGFAQSEIAANARQMANMQNDFSLQSALSNCCCENRLATANQTATILAEHCADRAVLSDGVRDIITNQNMGVQRILDVICQDKLDTKNEQILSLQNQLNMATMNASQVAQTAQIVAALTPTAAAAAAKSA